MKIHITSLLLLFCLRAAVVVAAAKPAIAFRSMVPQDAQTVYSVAQDSTGMMWVGTENGLYSYNGYNFNACFTHGETSNTRVHAILVQGGTLYLGTDNGMLLYSTATGSYTETPHVGTGEIRSLALYNGAVVCGAAKGLYRYDSRQNTIERLGYNINNVYSLLKHGNCLLVGTISGLYGISGARCRLIPVSGGQQPLVNAMLPDGSGGAWIGTEGALFRMGKDGHLSHEKMLAGNSVKSLARCRGLVFVGTDNGLYTLDTALRATHLTHDSRDEGSVASNIVWALTADRYGNLWAGTDNGLSVSLYGGFCDSVLLSAITGNGDGNCIYDIMRDRDGALWLGGSNGLIHHYQNGKVEWFRQNSRLTPLAHNRVRRIYKDNQGDILVCTDHGINLFDRQSGRFRNFIVTDQSGKYTTTWAYDIVQDRSGRYWISSYMGGVFMIDKARLLTSGGTVRADRHFAAGLKSIHVGRIALCRNGKLYLQLNENGIDCIDTNNFGITHVKETEGDNISFIMSDDNGDVWSAGSSVIRKHSADGQGDREYRLQDSPARRITAMCAVEDAVYAIAGHECMAFDSRGGSSRFAVSGGVPPLSICYDKMSNMVFLGGNDLLRSVSSDLDSYSGAERLVLSSVTVNGKPFSPEGSAASSADRIELASTQNNLTLRLTDMPYAGFRKCVYAYRLEGIDHDWQYLKDGSLDITYSALPHGDYTLRVCQVDGYGRAATSVYTLSLEVLPPWYLTVWAKLLYAVAIAGLCLWGINFYMMRKRLANERNARRQVMEQSRARAAFYSGLSRNIKSPLAKIMSQVSQLLHDETDARHSLSMESIRKSSADISLLVYEALDRTAPEAPSDGKSRHYEAVDMVDFCRRAVSDVRKEAANSKQEVGFHTDTPVIYMSVDLPGFYPLFFSFIGRAVFLAGGKAAVALSLSALRVPGNVVMTVEIPSHTIPSDILPFVFYRYRPADKQADGSVNLNELALLKDFTDNAGGTFTVESDSDKGTIFTLTLPCGTAAAHQKAAANAAQPAPQDSETTPVVIKAASPDMTDSGLLASITAVIETHISDSDFNVTRLAADVGIGDKSLYRRVKQLTGKTPVELIRHIRMQKASLLLREGKFSVSEVMYLVGFSNSSYFSKCFSKTYGITPAEYSKRAS